MHLRCRCRRVELCAVVRHSTMGSWRTTHVPKCNGRCPKGNSDRRSEGRLDFVQCDSGIWILPRPWTGSWESANRRSHTGEWRNPKTVEHIDGYIQSAQAATAILLVGGLYFVLQIGSADLADLTEAWLAPASYAAIAAIGVVLVFRGARSWHKMGQAKQDAHGCCGHAHGPSIQEIATLTSARDAVALIATIAMKPCTGALFVLVIASRFDAFAVGCLAVITMGLGTAAFNLSVVTSGVAARRLAGLGARDHQAMQAVSATLHVTGGVLIIAISIGMLLPYLD